MSNETKWTPGPWKYNRTNGCQTIGEHVISGGKPGYLAEVRDCGTGCVRANAHIIAAAPDLYEALASLLNDTAEEHIPTKLWLQARKAIAKAEGGGRI